MSAIRTKNVYLLRHGKTLGEPALNGHTDVLVDVVTQTAISQALSELEVSFDKVLTSPLKRCSDLADIFTLNANLSVVTEQDLQEMSFGDVDGVPFDDLQQQWELLESFWLDPANHQLPGAESLHSFQSRVISAWSHVLESENDNILLITHGGVIRVILAHILNVDWKNPSWYSNLAIANASLSHIQVSQVIATNSSRAQSTGSNVQALSPQNKQQYFSVKSIGSAII
ncbi:histidine phosphatase family protein [Vibrio makurazakiensis]|uniref:histidine phosphatase family protein n=1 Tax=Vibrio makurazakiensis TaxID=2910250 RepID=UPI003D0BB2F4